MGQANAPEHCEEPSAQEAFPRLLWRDLDQRRPPKRNTTEVGKNVVGNDHGDGQDEPNEPFENVVDDKMRLAHDEEERHVGPGKLGELKFVVSFL